MGKNIIQQKRGKGSPTYRAPSFRYVGSISHGDTASETKNGEVLDILHCRGHSSPLAKVRYEDGEEVYLPAAEGLQQGDNVSKGPEAKIEVGHTGALGNMPEGTFIYNIEAVPGDGGKFVRASGTFARVVGKVQGKVVVELPSKKQKQFHTDCRATIGVIAGGGRTEKPLLKAGTKYFKMKARNRLYPRVSGTSMNAVNHPFGGSSTHHKGKCNTPSRFAPPGAKVGLIRARQTGRKKGKRVQR